jgi:O-antigen chain-terminating methyltransferase
MEGLQQQVKMAFAEARFARGDAIKAHDFAIEAESRSKEHAARVEAMVLSTSWRITTPLRSAGRMLKSIKIIRVRHSGKLFLQHSALYIARRPVLKRFFLAVLKQFPNLKNRLAMLRHQQMASNPYTADNAPVERAHLSPRARKIYLDLKSAINKSSEEGH